MKHSMMMLAQLLGYSTGDAVKHSKLLKTLQRMLQTKQSEIVLVHGESGLVDILRIPVCDNPGYFWAGKFFQNSEIQEPYSPLMACLFGSL
jgi:hypothetical protein